MILPLVQIKKYGGEGTCGHEWQTSVKARSNGEKCPICSGARVIAGINDLATLEPLLAKQWSKKNKIKPTEVSIGSHKKVSGSEDSDVIYQPVYEVAGLEGAVYEVRAAEDISTPDGTLRYSKGEVVDTITTSSDGFVKSKELYLGKYEVKEITAPYGMVISGETHTVELTYAGQNISVTETSTSFYNERQKVQVSLAKAIEKDKTFGIGDNGEIKNISFEERRAGKPLCHDGERRSNALTLTGTADETA